MGKLGKRKKTWSVTTQEDYLSERGKLDAQLNELEAQLQKRGIDLLGVKKRSVEKKIEETRADIRELVTARQEEMKRQIHQHKERKNSYILLAVAVLAGLILMLLSSLLPEKKSQPDAPAAVVNAQEDAAPAESAPEPEPSFLAVHFIDVGQADAILVVCDNHATMIDGGNVADSSLVYTYLKNHNIDTLDCIFATHPHEDHVGGLPGALRAATTKKMYSPVAYYDSEPFNDLVKTLSAQGAEITVPSVGKSLALGSARLTVLSCGYADDDWNDASIVLRLVYNNISFLFTADAGTDVEQYILSSEKNIKSTVLKVGHHGGESATGESWLSAVQPEYAVISVGAKNSYGHPAAATLGRLQDAGVKLFRTDLQGDIVFYCQGDEISVLCEKNKGADTFAVPAEETAAPVEDDANKDSSGGDTRTAGSGEANTNSSGSVGTSSSSGGAGSASGGETNAGGQATSGGSGNGSPSSTAVVREYWVNTNTGKFHYPSCSHAKKISANNLWICSCSRDDLIAKGYSPCKVCTP